jgi:hypothetical protein
MVEADLSTASCRSPASSSSRPDSGLSLVPGPKQGQWLRAGGKPLRDRRGEILFIDARNLGEMEDRTHRILPEADIAQITGTYHAWRGDGDAAYQDILGFCSRLRWTRFGA